MFFILYLICTMVLPFALGLCFGWWALAFTLPVSAVVTAAFVQSLGAPAGTGNLARSLGFLLLMLSSFVMLACSALGVVAGQ